MMDDGALNTGLDNQQIDRRKALKAALGGAAAAAVVAGPAVSGFGVVPAYGQVASPPPPTDPTPVCTNASDSLTRSVSCVVCGGTDYCCWGNPSNSPCGCPLTSIGSVSVANGPSVAISVEGRMRLGGSVQMSVSGATGIYNRCSLAVGGTCPPASTFTAGTPNSANVGNSTYTSSIACSGTGPGPAGLTVTLSCVCP